MKRKESNKRKSSKFDKSQVHNDELAQGSAPAILDTAMIIHPGHQQYALINIQTDSLNLNQVESPYYLKTEEGGTLPPTERAVQALQPINFVTSPLGLQGNMIF